jgi:hypothetical protein
LAESPPAGLATDARTVCVDDRPLADLINPLVITDAGTLKPIAYDFNPQFNVASIEGLSSDVLRQYKQHELAPFQELIGGAVAGLQNAQDFVDWFDHCTRLSEAPGGILSEAKNLPFMRPFVSARRP